MQRTLPLRTRIRGVLAVFVMLSLLAGHAVAQVLDMELPRPRTHGPQVQWDDIRLYSNFSKDGSFRNSLNLRGRVTHIPRDIVVAYRLELPGTLLNLSERDQNASWADLPQRSSSLMRVIKPDTAQQQAQAPARPGGAAGVPGVPISISSLAMKKEVNLPQTLQGKLHLLQAAEMREIEVPLKEDAIVELQPGISIQVTKLSKSGSSYRPEFKLIWGDGDKDREHNYNMTPFLWAMIPLNDHGEPIRASNYIYFESDNKVRGQFYAYRNQQIHKVRIRWVTRTSERTLRFALDKNFLTFPPSPNKVAGPVEIAQPESSIGRAEFVAANANYNVQHIASDNLRTNYNITPTISLKLKKPLEFVSYRMPRLINVIDERDRNILALLNESSSQMQQATYLRANDNKTYEHISGRSQPLVRVPKRIKRVTGDIAMVIATAKENITMETTDGTEITLPDDGKIELAGMELDNDDDTRVKLRYNAKYVVFEPQDRAAFVHEVRAIRHEGEPLVGRRRSWSSGGNDGMKTGTWQFEFSNINPKDIKEIQLNVISETDTVVVPFEARFDD